MAAGKEGLTMDLRLVLQNCRHILVSHYPISREREIRAIDAALAAPLPVLDHAQIERLALSLEIPVGTVARVLMAARAETEDPSSAYVTVAGAAPDGGRSDG
jgi:hypothetical protein